MKKKVDGENVNKFSDFSNKSWIMETDGQTINVADSALKLMKGEGNKIEFKDILHGALGKLGGLLLTTMTNFIFSKLHGN
jgi:hypothetical protein